jgi:hypothetical protein
VVCKAGDYITNQSGKGGILETFLCGALCLLGGWLLGIMSISETEGKKAKEGKYTVHDGVIYRYVKV